MRAGSSRIEITPPAGLPMGGYLVRSERAEGVHDPLFARALVLDDGQERVAIVAADLTGIDPSQAAAVRRRVEQEVGIPASHTLVAVSHTHSAPLVASRRVNAPDLPYAESVQDKLAAAVREAAEGLRPARVGAGRAKLYLGVNRREPTPDGRIVIGWNPAGYASPYADILVAAEEGGGPLGILFTYGAHPVVLGPENLEISGDYPGCAERTVEANFGGTAVALFALGFAGNVNVKHDKQDFHEVEAIGTVLARAVLEEMKGIRLERDALLGARSVRVALPLEPPPPPGEAERILFAERERLSSVLGRGEDKAEINRRRMMVEWASELVELAGRGATDHFADLEIQLITIGRTALVALSAEVFAEYAKMVRGLSPFEHTFPISVANGSIGYIPTAAAFDQGGYEVEIAPRHYGALRLRAGAETIVHEALAGLLGVTAAAGGVPSLP